jgi:3-oxoacyl-[acyl-carrier protein] reductase
MRLVSTPPGRILAKRVGLPTPVALRRHRLGEPVVEGPVLLGGSSGGRLLEPV